MTKSNYAKSCSGTTRTINFGPHICDLCLWIDALLYSLGETKNFQKVTNWTLWCPKSVQRSAICDRFVYWMYYECNGIGGPELVCGWSRDHKKRGSDIRLMTFHLFRNVSFVCYPYVMDICINVYVCMHSYTATWLRQSNVCVHTMHILLET